MWYKKVRADLLALFYFLISRNITVATKQRETRTTKMMTHLYHGRSSDLTALTFEEAASTDFRLLIESLLALALKCEDPDSCNRDPSKRISVMDDT